MKHLFEVVNRIFAFIVPISDFLWNFPKDVDAYARIPVLGQFSFAMLLLIGSGIYFTIRMRGVQFRKFVRSIRIATVRTASETGISPFAAFMLSSAMRVGPGNIMGVTGAVSVGGPGAVFWMWVAAAFGMALAFVEATLAQLYKEKKDDQYVGGLPFYGMKILGNRRWVGIALSVLFIGYALLNVPSQTFHLFTALGSVASTVAGTPYARTSGVYYGIGLFLIVYISAIVLGGLKRVVKVVNIWVPVMAVLYCGIVLTLVFLNWRLIPFFFGAVFSGAFSPEAVFGGAFGIALQQGVKRGLMANEAGQGTITMAAAAASNDHPVEQGLVQSMGVFFDTMIVCSMAGFVSVMAQLWTSPSGIVWEAIREDKLLVFMTAAKQLAPGTAFDAPVQALLSLCYALFASMTLIGMITFAEISANMISRKRTFLLGLRATGALFLVPFGVLTVLADLQLGNIWYLADMLNILVVFANVPILLIGQKHVFRALEHYERTGGKEGFVSKRDIGLDSPYWTQESHDA
ncbi:MAG: amino acid carrier protein [Holophagales bacterium]|nr:amino acid carrier protein [Holophagales bacterium]